ncbi:hypothetical protein Tco_0091599 [Tanacetum coccineum]
MDPCAGLGRLCINDSQIITLNDMIENEGDWSGPKYVDTSDSKKKVEKAHKGGGGGRGVKEKQQCLANVAEKNTVVVSSLAVDEPMDATVNIEDVNVGQTNSPTVNPKPDSRQEYPPINFAELGITSCMRQVPDVNVVNIINDYSNLGPAASTTTLTNSAKISKAIWSSYVRAMIELRANVELKDNIVATMPKIIGEATILVIFVLSMSGNLLDVHVVSKKPTANASINKKKNVEPTKEVSKSNPFEVLTSVENDMKLGTNGGTLNLASQTTNSSGSSFWNVHANSPSTTPIVEKIDKIEKLIIERKVTLVDDEGEDVGLALILRTYVFFGVIKFIGENLYPKKTEKNKKRRKNVKIYVLEEFPPSKDELEDQS